MNNMKTKEEAEEEEEEEVVESMIEDAEIDAELIPVKEASDEQTNAGKKCDICNTKMLNQVSEKRPKRKNLEFFIREVAKHTALYDKTDKLSKDITFKKPIWTAIGIKFGMSARDAEKKWRVQRDRYNRERRKVKETSSNLNGSVETYSPSWELYWILDKMINPSTSQIERNLMASAPDILASSSVYDVDESGLHSIIEDSHEYEIQSEIIEQDLLYGNVTPTSSSSSATVNKHCTSRGTMTRSTDSNKTQSPNGNAASTSVVYTNPQMDNIVSRFCEYLEARLLSLDKIDRRDVMHRIEIMMIEKESDDKYT